MKLARYSAKGEIKLGAVKGESLVELSKRFPAVAVYTGTPGGVGMEISPPQLLKPGDKVRVEIDRIAAIEAITLAEPLS